MPGPLLVSSPLRPMHYVAMYLLDIDTLGRGVFVHHDPDSL